MHNTLRLAALLLGLLALPGGSACSGESGPPGAGKNLLLITLDTTRADALSCMGADPRSTPRIDALARRSTLFTYATSETNITNPSHISIMTGLPAIEHRVVSNAVLLPGRLDTLAEALQRDGYDTAAFAAAWHLASLGWRGFGTIPPVEGVLDGEEVADRALAWLQGREGDEPFFLWVHFFDTHVVYSPPSELAREFYSGNPTQGDGPPLVELGQLEAKRDKLLIRWLRDARDPEYPRAMYAASMRHMDNQVGRLLDAVSQLGLDEQTIVVLSGDHGENLDDHKPFYNHRSLYEENLRIPMLVHVPGAPAGRHDGPVMTIDIVPTLQDAMGFELERQPMGISLFPRVMGLEQPALEQRDLLVHQQAHNHSVAVRQGDWKLWCPIAVGEESAPEGALLFNLREDPGETRNLLLEEPQRAAALERAVQPWVRVQGIDKGALMKRSRAEREMLRDLGYAGGDDD